MLGGASSISCKANMRARVMAKGVKIGAGLSRRLPKQVGVKVCSNLQIATASLIIKLASVLRRACMHFLGHACNLRSKHAYVVLRGFWQDVGILQRAICCLSFFMGGGCVYVCAHPCRFRQE